MTIYNTSSILKELDQVIIDLLIQTPFFGHFFAKTIKTIDPLCFGISIALFNQESVQLFVNPDYWQNHLKSGDRKKTLELRKMILKKQLIHFIFNHDMQIQDFENETIFIVAAEFTINQYLKQEEQLTAFDSSLYFPDLNSKPFKKLRHYYNTLSKKLNINNINEVIGLETRYFDFYKNWKNQPVTEQDKELNWYFRKKIILDSFLSENSNAGKTLATPLFSYLNQLKKETYRSINWKKIVRLFVNSSNRTKLTNTIHRSSKRFGTFPGIRIRKQSRLLVAVDTSGSINEDSLTHFFSEIHQLWKQKNEIRILECDTIIQREYNYEGVPPKVITGKGNTDFNEPIRFSNEVFHPDALIYFTDGFGPSPRIKSLKPILWVINNDGIKRHSKSWNDLPGRKVKMNEVQ